MIKAHTYFEILQGKILHMDSLKKSLSIWSLYSKKIVFTNGVFDLLHFGHIQYLSKAKDLGDKLIVGLNSDDSARRLNKGVNRPIQDEQSRATILAALHVVDAVIVFNEDTPQQLIEAIQPDVLVKGGDYKDLTQIAGYEVVSKKGGIITTIEFADGFSTSAIEKKIKES